MIAQNFYNTAIFLGVTALFLLRILETFINKKDTDLLKAAELKKVLFSTKKRSGSSRSEVFCKKGVLRNFAKYTEKQPS